MLGIDEFPLQTLKVNIWPSSTRVLLHTSVIANKASSARAHVSDFFSHTQPKTEQKEVKKCVRGDDRKVKSTIALILKQ